MPSQRAQRLDASNKKVALLREYHHWEKELAYYNKELAASAVCEQIAVECLISAVTLGAAGAIGRRLAARAVRSSNLIYKGRFARTLEVLAARSPGGAAAASFGAGEGGVLLTRGEMLARRIRITEAACMTLGRLSAALLQQPARAAIGQDLTWSGLAVGLLTAAGVPGPATAGAVSWTSSGSVLSYQGANVVLGTLAKTFPFYQSEELQKDQEYLALLESFNVAAAVQDTSDDLALGLWEYAHATEGTLARDTEAVVRRQDFSSSAPFLARHFSNATSHVRNYTAKLTAIDAQHRLWTNTHRNLVVLERATKAALEIGQAPR